jgi:cysteine synthase A
MAGRALVEQYVVGPEVSVEMFSRDGSATLVGITAKSLLDPPFFVEGRHLFPADLPAEVAEHVEGVVTAALTATGIRTGATHTEVRLGPDGPAVIEINARPAGGMIPELVRLATGVDLVEQHLRAAAALPLDLLPVRAGYAGIAFLTATRVGHLRAVRGVSVAAREPGVVQVVLSARAGLPVRPPRDAYDRLGFVIAASETSTLVAAALDRAVGHADLEIA